MIFTFALLLRITLTQALISPNWRHLRSGPSSLVLKFSSSISRSVTALIPRTITPSPRMFTTSIFSSSSSSSPEKRDALEKRIGALRHLLNGGNSTTASDDIREFVPIYEGADKDWLLSMLDLLEWEKTELQRRDVALQRLKSTLAKGKTIEWKQIGTLEPQEDLSKLKVNDTVTVNLAGSGLAEHSDLFILHVRAARVDLWKHLAETDKRVSFVSGPPGIGMSMDVYAYALWEAHTHHKRVLYVHGGDDEYSVVLVSAGTNNMRVGEGLMDQNDHYFLVDIIKPFLEQREVDIVVLDGQISPVIMSIFVRLLKFPDVRMISCTPFHLKISTEAMDHAPEFSDFVMDSWTKEEYDAAIVTGALVLHSPSLTVDEMFYYAGGSIRMMQWSVEHVIIELIRKLRVLPDMGQLIGRGCVDYSSQIVANSLMTIYDGQSIVLSKFVAMMLLITVTDRVVERARMVLHYDPAWQGLVMVLEVLNLAHKRPSMLFRNALGGIEEWPRLRPDSSLPLPTFSSASDSRLSDSQQDWLVPDRYTHDSFDAIYRVSLDTARVIKCTVADSHNCNLGYLIPLVKAMNVHVIELDYVCRSYNFDTFQVPTPELKPKGKVKKNSEYQQYMDLKDTITKIWRVKCSSNEGSSYPDPAIIIRHVTYQQKDSSLPLPQLRSAVHE